MDQAELKIRVVFASAAMVALCALVAGVLSGTTLEHISWPTLVAPACALLIASVEALGVKKVASSFQVRLLVSVLIGACCLALLER